MPRQLFATGMLKVALPVFVKIRNDVQIVNANAGDPLDGPKQSVWDLYLFQEDVSLATDSKAWEGSPRLLTKEIIPKTWRVMQQNKL